MKKEIKFYISFIFCVLFIVTACANAPETGGNGSSSSGGNSVSQVLTPDFSPSGGIYSSVTNVTINCGTSGAVIHYTTNGSGPTAESPVYSAPIVISSSLTVKAFAVKEGMTDSGVAGAGYIIQLPGIVSAPTFQPSGGTFDGPQTVSINSATPDAYIYYTLDNTDPDSNSVHYTASFTVSSPLTVKAKAFKTNMTPSTISSASFSFAPATPEITPASGTFDSAQTVSITCGTTGSSVYFSTNGGNSYQIYSAPFVLNGSGNRLISAYASKPGYSGSVTNTKTYRFRSWSQFGDIPMNFNYRPHSMVIDSLNRVYLSVYDDTRSSGTQCGSVYRFDGAWSNLYNHLVYNQVIYYQILAVKANNDVVELFSDVNYKGSVHEFDGYDWHWIGSNISYCTPGSTYYQADLDLDQYGAPYVAFKDDAAGSKISVTKCVDNVWQVLGSRGFAAVDLGIDLAVAPDGTPYVNVNNGGMWIMKFNGVSWVTVGSQPVVLNSYYETSIAIDASGTPYVATGGSGSHKLNVYKYASGNWINVGGSDLSEGSITHPILKFSPQGVLYVCYHDYNYNYVRVMKLNGTNWAAIGLPGDLLGADCFGIDGNGVPYVAYPVTDASYNTRIKVWKLEQ